LYILTDIHLLQSKKEFFVWLVTFTLTAFYALEMGIYVSVALCGAEVRLCSYTTQPHTCKHTHTHNENLLVVLRYLQTFTYMY
jgi:MFS superfamily sulfate permease-like transporter